MIVIGNNQESTLKPCYINDKLTSNGEQYLWTDESCPIHDALSKWWKHIWRNQVLGKYHCKIIEESQHENLEEVHEHKELEVPVGQYLPHQGFQRGKRKCWLGSLVNGYKIWFRSFVIKTALAVDASIGHAYTAYDSDQHCEDLEGAKVFHVFGHHTTEEDTGGADERSHLQRNETKMWSHAKKPTQERWRQNLLGCTL